MCQRTGIAGVKIQKKFQKPPKLARLAHANCGDPGKKGKTSVPTYTHALRYAAQLCGTAS